MKRPTTLEAVQVRPYRREDEPEVLALLRTTLGPGPAGERSSEFFRWKHLDNPFGPSFLLVAEVDGRIVGLRAFLRWGFRSGVRRISAVRAVDTATHPDFQGMGIFSRLTREALEAIRPEVDLVFNTPNAQSGPGYLKLGWRTVGKIPVWVRVRRPVRFARGVRGSGSSVEPTTPRPSVNAPTAAEALDDAEAITPLLERAALPDGRLATARDLGYLRWRYAGASFFDYRATVLEEGGAVDGLAIFRLRPRGSRWETTIAELIVPGGARSSTRRLLRRVIRSAPVDHLTCHFSLASGGRRTGHPIGFIPAPRGIGLVVKVLRPGLVPDPTDLRSWAFSLGDVEIF